MINRRYFWDAADRLTELVDLERGMRRYAYDERSRLIGVDGDQPELFTFDPASNILASTSDRNAGSPGLAVGDRLLMRGDRKFDYDACGNRVREVRGAGGGVERCYHYRADNQLAEVEECSRLGRRVTSFLYDALGRRTEKRSRAWGPQAANDDATGELASDITTMFVWNGDVLLAEGRPGDPLATVYLHEPRSFRPLAQVRRGPESAAAIRHYQLDHLGTPVELVNDDGQVLWRNRSRAWGGGATAVADDDVSQPIRFLGQYHDAETGLHYNRFRFYAPDEGCYVQQDPIRLAGGQNVSAYVENPNGWFDAYGLCPLDRPDDTQYLYRGVSADHPEIGQARVGTAVPGDVNSMITADEHNAGGVSSISPYTSWTRNIGVARSYANSQGNGGVILQVPVGAPPAGASWSWDWSPDIYNEQEVLLRGVRTGTGVISP